jgi:hypothetical protein
MVLAAPTSAWRIARVASTSRMIAAFQIDQIIVRIGEERVSFVSAGPLCCGIGLADELRHDLAGPTPKTLNQHIDSSKNFCNRSL